MHTQAWEDMEEIRKHVKKLRQAEWTTSGNMFKRQRSEEDRTGLSTQDGRVGGLSGRVWVHPWSFPCWATPEYVNSQVLERLQRIRNVNPRGGGGGGGSVDAYIRSCMSYDKARMDLERLEGRVRGVVAQCAAALRERLSHPLEDADPDRSASLRSWHLQAEWRALASELSIHYRETHPTKSATELADSISLVLELYSESLTEEAGKTEDERFEEGSIALQVFVDGVSGDVADLHVRVLGRRISGDTEANWAELARGRQMATLRDRLAITLAQVRFMQDAQRHWGEDVDVCSQLEALASRYGDQAVPFLPQIPTLTLSPSMHLSIGLLPQPGKARPVKVHWQMTASGVVVDEARVPPLSSIHYGLILHEPVLMHRSMLEALIQVVYEASPEPAFAVSDWRSSSIDFDGTSNANASMATSASTTSTAASSTTPISAGVTAPANMSNGVAPAGGSVPMSMSPHHLPSTAPSNHSVAASIAGAVPTAASPALTAPNGALHASAMGSTSSLQSSSSFGAVELYEVTGAVRLVCSVESPDRRDFFRVVSVPFTDPRQVPALLFQLRLASTFERLYDSLIRPETVVLREERLFRAVMADLRVRYGRYFILRAVHRGRAFRLRVALDPSSGNVSVVGAPEPPKAIVDRLCESLDLSAFISSYAELVFSSHQHQTTPILDEVEIQLSNSANLEYSAPL